MATETCLTPACPGPPEESSPCLVPLEAGFSFREYRLGEGEVLIGRDGALCGLVAAGALVSRRHLRITGDSQGRFFAEDLDSTNGLFVNGSRVTCPVELTDGDLLGLGTAVLPNLRFQRQSDRQGRQRLLPPKDHWLIGRSPDCDLALPCEATVSDRHALLRVHRGRLMITDLHSLNGTWINGRSRLAAEVRANHTVLIGSTRFRFQLTGDGSLAVQQWECGQAVRLECVDLGRRLPGRSGRMLLDEVTLAVAPGEFVGILGPSGAGKTTLLNLLAGLTRPDRGQVLYNEEVLDDRQKMFRNTVGYVPQDDILHPELSVGRSLEYLARLRLSPDLSNAQRATVVDSTIETLGLGPVRRTPIQKLSGGQRKRVSIGAELLVRPGLLLLDEPTSGLDPSTEERMMRHFKEMTRRGTTVVITTHVLYNLELLDKVAILAQGRLVYFGPPADAPSFFSTADAPLKRPTALFDLLTGEGHGAATADQEDIARDWSHRFRKSRHYRQQVTERLSRPASVLARADHRAGTRTNLNTSPEPAAGSSVSWRGLPAAGSALAAGLRAWLILTGRQLRIRASSGNRLLLLLFLPLVLALVTLSQPIRGVVDDATVRGQQEDIRSILAGGGPAMDSQLKLLLSPAGTSDPRTGAQLLYGLRHQGAANLPVPISVLLMMVMTAIFSGTLIACLEIAGEHSIYRRERRSHLGILAYLGSKLPFCFAVTGLQSALFLAVCTLDPTLRQAGCGSLWLIMTGLAWSSAAMGLLLSALDPTPGRMAVMLAIGVVLPQLILSGGLGPDFYRGMGPTLHAIADLLPARWGLSMALSSVYGSLSGEGAGWVPGFVREVIGFDFGLAVYYSGAMRLFLQFSIWIVLAAAILRLRDARCR